jgi:hypothetical protein
MINYGKLKKISNSIINNCRDWNEKYAIEHPNTAKIRQNNYFNTSNYFKKIISIFIYPKKIHSKKIVLFEGLKFSNYIESFKTNEVSIIGSRYEKKYAKEKMYNFHWSFPIINSVNEAIYNKNSIYLICQILYWYVYFYRKEEIIIVLEEDTQPLGSFFVCLSKLFKNKYHTICIQHGYFFKEQSARPDGQLCDYNFVWDKYQIDLMGIDKNSTFIIGLPYEAVAKISENYQIILVGIGEPDDIFYQMSLQIFKKIYDFLIDKNYKVQYRPHPNEKIKSKNLINLEKLFGDLDNSEKIALLNGNQKIFIGNISSLLYEAKMCGHYSVSFELRMNQIISNVDYVMDINKLDLLLEKIIFFENIKSIYSNNIDNNNPNLRFNQAMKYTLLR